MVINYFSVEELESHLLKFGYKFHHDSSHQKHYNNIQRIEAGSGIYYFGKRFSIDIDRKMISLRTGEFDDKGKILYSDMLVEFPTEMLKWFDINGFSFFPSYAREVDQEIEDWF